ncbi:MAG TPA: hypothetical protein VHF23_07895 [Gaiellaceae bacterium]|nr:hypothetical protein [Gaiellaceae bacterium]
MTDRELRLAKNEALFRGVNERVREVKGELPDAGPASKIEFICECGRSDCVDHVTLTVAEYEQVRAEETHFVLKPGHEAPDVEDVVRTGDGYVVVEKHPGEGAVARETDPRS